MVSRSKQLGEVQHDDGEQEVPEKGERRQRKARGKKEDKDGNVIDLVNAEQPEPKRARASRKATSTLQKAPAAPKPSAAKAKPSKPAVQATSGSVRPEADPAVPEHAAPKPCEESKAHSTPCGEVDHGEPKGKKTEKLEGDATGDQGMGDAGKGNQKEKEDDKGDADGGKGDEKEKEDKGPTFAGRYCPKNGMLKDRWVAIRDVFNQQLKHKVKTPSKQQALSSNVPASHLMMLSLVLTRAWET